MLFIRPVKEDDLDAMLRMSIESGAGMTTMPNDEATWLSKIQSSKKTFARAANTHDEGSFFLVAEDSETGQAIGTTAIYVGVGTTMPFYSYRKSLLVKYSKELEKIIEIPVLNLVNDFTRAAEMGSLFLTQSYRHSGHGQFLSRARYLLMADFPDRIADDVIAEMRGYQADDGHSPFWQALGKQFFDLPFENADYLSATKGNQFIQDLMPKYPVYVGLLPEEAQECVGKPHVVSAKAMHMLEKEGFRYDGYVDVFDGGPTVHCRREQIQSVRDATTYSVKITHNLTNENQRYVISNHSIEDYRMVLQPANLYDDHAEISAEAADILGVSAGDTINLFAMREKTS